MEALDRLKKACPDTHPANGLCSVQPADTLAVAGGIDLGSLDAPARKVVEALVKGATGAGNAPKTYVQACDLRVLIQAAG